MQHRFARRACLACRILAVEHEHGRRSLGHAIALLERDAAGLPDLQQRHRHGRAANAADIQPPEIGRRERRMLRHELIDRGHAEEHADLICGDRAEDPPDAWEKTRNDKIAAIQGNRNRFIDRAAGGAGRTPR